MYIKQYLMQIWIYYYYITISDNIDYYMHLYITCICELLFFFLTKPEIADYDMKNITCHHSYRGHIEIGGRSISVFSYFPTLIYPPLIYH